MRSLLRDSYPPAFALALAGLLAACPAREAAPDVPAPQDVLSPRDASTRRVRRRRNRVRAAPGGGRAAVGAPVEVAAEANEEPMPARPRTNPETGPVLPEDLGPPPAQSFDLTQAGAAGPMGLEPSQISRGFAPLMARFGACAEFATSEEGRGPHGRVNVRLRIRGDGRPVAARVSGGGGDPPFVLCVRRVVAAARFDRFAGVDIFATWGFDID